MSEPMEDEIRRALARRAADLSPEGADAIMQIDYRGTSTRRKTISRDPSRFRLRSAIGAAVIALAAGIAAAVVLLSPGTPSAYAGWSPIPTTPSQAAVAAATAACDAMHPGPLAAKAMGGKPVLTDARGRYTAVVTNADDVLEVCISGGGRKGQEVGGMNLRFDAKPGPDQLGGFSGGGGGAPGFAGRASGEEHVVGMAGRDVTGVTFLFSNGVTVDGTVQNGFYFAWWPYRRNPPRGALPPAGNPTTVEVTFSSGKTLTSPMSARTCQAKPGSCVFARSGFATP